jgi:hypothetical protein
MMKLDSRFDPINYYTGVFHLHSGYSHDGHDTILEMSSRLKAEGIDFCVLTDHFEDFDEMKFQKYINELEAVNSLRQTVFVPAIEVEFDGFHIIMLPVSRYGEIRASVDRKDITFDHLIKILAHPTKYDMPDVVKLLKTNQLDGIEIWNQQADGNYAPSSRFFLDLLGVVSIENHVLIFGSDIHSMRHRINNLLLIPRSGDLTPDFVIYKLKQREFVNYNRNLGQSLPGYCSTDIITEWLRESESGLQPKALIIRHTKEFLRFFYHLLPRSVKCRINNFKNAVKNKL